MTKREVKWMKVVVFAVLVLVAVILVFSFSNVFAENLKGETPLGIKVSANQKAIAQYEQYWGLKWEDIDWGDLDLLWLAQQQYYYSLGFDKALSIDPKKFKVIIHPWSPFCIDENGDPDSKEFQSAYGCIDGLYPGHIHLGDDDAQGSDSFCRTALSHEWNHRWIKLLKIKGCFWGIDTGKEECRIYDPSMWSLKLCQ